jgi:hypothetical protein
LHFFDFYDNTNQLLELCKESMTNMSLDGRAFVIKYDFKAAIFANLGLEERVIQENGPSGFIKSDHPPIPVDMDCYNIKIKHKYLFRIFKNMMPPSWGCELWDGYDSVFGHLTTRADLLVDVYARFFKEKAELEKEYAKGLRKLVAKYEPVKKKKNKKDETKEPTEISSFR